MKHDKNRRKKSKIKLIETLHIDVQHGMQAEHKNAIIHSPESYHIN